MRCGVALTCTLFFAVKEFLAFGGHATDLLTELADTVAPLKGGAGGQDLDLLALKDISRRPYRSRGLRLARLPAATDGVEAASS
jgi:hypothetical protein